MTALGRATVRTKQAEAVRRMSRRLSCDKALFSWIMAVDDVVAEVPVDVWSPVSEDECKVE